MQRRSFHTFLSMTELKLEMLIIGSNTKEDKLERMSCHATI